MSQTDITEGEFCWNELMTSDVTKSKQFYQSLFGWQTEEHDMGHATYTMIKRNNKDIGGMMAIPLGYEGQMPPHWMSYVYVQDVEKTCKKAESLGAEIKKPPMDIGDFGRLAVIMDPTGAHIAIWQSLKEC